MVEDKSGKVSGEAVKAVPDDWKLVFDSEAISRSISRISYEILERERNLSKLAIVGIRTGGEILSKRIQERIESIEGTKIAHGTLDITLYRDDIPADGYPLLKGTDLPFRVSGARIILVDDVLYTGRTIRAALDAVIDFGRPSRVELAVLVDRGHRELPIRPDYVGKNIPTSYEQSVKIRLKEQGYQDGVYLINHKGKRFDRGE